MTAPETPPDDSSPIVTAPRAAIVAIVLSLLALFGINPTELIEDSSPPTTTVPPTTTTEAPPTTTTTIPPTTTTEPPPPTTTEPPPSEFVRDFCDFATDDCQLDQFVQYRQNLTPNSVFVGEHGLAPDWTIENQHCTAPETTRPLYRNLPHEHVYRCVPGGNLDAAHQMSNVLNAAPYVFTGSSMPKIHEGIQRLAFQVNMTNNGGRSFWEIAVIPADQSFVDGMPCGGNLPCNDNYDYETLGAIGFGNRSQVGTAFRVATPTEKWGNLTTLSWSNRTEIIDGEIVHTPCSEISGTCFHAQLHSNTSSVRERYQVVVEKRGDDIWFGQEAEDGQMHWVIIEDQDFPEGPVRVVLKFHSYTPDKSYDGWPQGNGRTESSAVNNFTWHWDDFEVVAESSVNSADFYNSIGGTFEDHFVTHPYPGCVAFAEGARGTNRDANSGLDPVISCPDSLFGAYAGDNVVYGDVFG